MDINPVNATTEVHASSGADTNFQDQQLVRPLLRLLRHLTSGTYIIGATIGSASTILFVDSPAIAQQIQTQASFNGANGASPSALAPAGNGVYLGTASVSVSPPTDFNNFGNIFSYDAINGIQTLATFNGFNGFSPNSLINTSSGAYLGTTLNGGASFDPTPGAFGFFTNPGYGTIFSYNAATGIQALASFTGANGASPTALAPAGNGTYLGTTAASVAPATNFNNFGNIFSYDATNGIQTLATFNGFNGYSPNSLINAGNDDFLVTTLNGGASFDPTPGVFGFFTNPGNGAISAYCQGIGTTVNNPILPSSVNQNGGFVFQVPVASLCSLQYLDPPIATGYDYEIFGSLFSSVVAPSNLVDTTFDILVGDDSCSSYAFQSILTGGVVYDFTQPTKCFRIEGIDVAEMLDPTDPLAFATGVTVVDSGEYEVTQTPIITNVPDSTTTSVPAPLTIFGAATAIAYSRRLRRRIAQSKDLTDHKEE